MILSMTTSCLFALLVVTADTTGFAHAAKSLQQQYFGVDVPAGPNTKLPNDGSVQALRMRAIGTQNYECEKNEKDGSFAWALPRGSLDLRQARNRRCLCRTGRHALFRRVSGPVPGWDLGTNCGPGTDPTDRKCDAYTARWREAKTGSGSSGGWH